VSYLLLIRHGENDYSRRGRFAGRMPRVHLNERGRAQARELADALAKTPIKAIYASPLERAMETARPIATALRLPLRQEAGLLEADVGAWQGRSIARVSRTRAWRIIQQAPSRAVHPAGESFIQIQTRVVTALERIMERHRPRDLLACIFHADPIKLAVAHYLGLPLDHVQRLACDTASLTLLAVSPHGAHLIWLNRRAPLGATLARPGR
jgi:broad specificity phosphatase PhoE